ncbi:hypothetical protein ZWY2020_019720 [Hordeum vulgare]|nr:hypothetical protein ZWY2020_019720 [Hordeum vulgare]
MGNVVEAAAAISPELERRAGLRPSVRSARAGAGLLILRKSSGRLLSTASAARSLSFRPMRSMSQSGVLARPYPTSLSASPDDGSPSAEEAY